MPKAKAASKSISRDDCLIWPAAKDKDGYGLVKIKQKQLRVHRVALEIKIGRKLVESECALHLCNQPSCFYSDHLIVGTVQENNQMKREGQKTLADMFLEGWKTIY